MSRLSDRTARRTAAVRRNVKRAVSQLIAGVCLLDAMLVASQGQQLAAAICALGLGATLLAQRYVPGT